MGSNFVKKCFKKQNQIWTLSLNTKRAREQQDTKIYTGSFQALKLRLILDKPSSFINFSKLQVFFCVTTSSYKPNLSPSLNNPIFFVLPSHSWLKNLLFVWLTN